MEHAATDTPTTTADAHEVGHRSPLPDDAPVFVRHAVESIVRSSWPVTGLRRIPRTDVAACATHDVYEDALGYVYRFDPTGRRVVSIDRPEDSDHKARQARSAARIAVAELRDRAIAVVATQHPEFGCSRAGYHPLEGNRRRDLYLFRWEDCSSPLAESDEPPFVEVALYADGSLVRYADTLLVPT